MENKKPFLTKDKIGKFYLEVVCHAEKDIEKVKLKLLDLEPNLEIDYTGKDRLYAEVKGNSGTPHKKLEKYLDPDAYPQLFFVKEYDGKLCKSYYRFSHYILPHLNFIYDEEDNGKVVAAYLPADE